MKKKWLEHEIHFLIKNYPNLGNKTCSLMLNRPIGSISCKAHRLGLKLSSGKMSEIKKDAVPEKNNFNFELLDKINSNFAYVLGFIWADGFVDKKTNNIKVGCVIDDILEIEKNFQECGTWLEYLSKEKNWKTRKILSITNRKLHKFLADNDYMIKSKTSPKKIINVIPKEFHRYFLLGLIDGDGCFYYNKKRNLRQFSITGTYNQEWDGVEILLNSIGITKYHIQRRAKKGSSSSSVIRITNKSDINVLGTYIYSGVTYGLNRKRDIFFEMMLN